MFEPAKTAIELVVACFTVAAIWIGTAQAFGRLRGRRIWITFFVEIVVLAAIFGPALLGPPWYAGAILVIGLASTREMTLTIARTDMGAAAGRGLRWGRPLLIALFYPGLFLAFLVALGASPTGFADVFFCYAMVELNDSCAYLVGATFGKARPFPNLSPNKTLAGLVGGPILTVAISPLFHFALPELSLPELLLAAALLAVLGSAGDLIASAIKRAARVKDFGTWVPTHGGVLDVYDSLIFVAPFFWAFLSYYRVR